METSKDVAILIVTYNGMQWLKDCLDSCTDYTTIVVDNASTDETVSFIKANYPSVHLQEESVNLGFGQANNKGISWALQQGFENVFLLNQDAYIVPGCLEKIAVMVRKYTNYGILSPIHLNGKGNRLDQRFARHVRYENNADIYSDYVLGQQREPIYEVPFVNAAGWWVTQKCLTTVGGFDPLFFHYGEDDNYCQRVLYHQLKIGIVPETFIKHDREERLKKQPNNPDKHYLDLIGRRFKKNYANVNTSDSLDTLLKKRKNEALRALLKLDLSTRTLKLQEVQLIQKLLASIEKSRSKNIVPGAHYLNL